MIPLRGFTYVRSGRRALSLHRAPGLLLVLLLAMVGPAHRAFAQAAESADAGRTFIWAGGGLSYYNLQYGDHKNVGITAFADADTVRRIGLEAEARWLDFHQTSNVHAETYLGGVRYHFNVGRFQPYVKGLAGLGEFNFTYNYAHGSYFVIAPGGGVDYFLKPRVSIRVADFEYQYWPQFTFGAMTSVGITSGIRFRVF